MSTISTTITHPITLAESSAYTSPLKIAASGGVVTSSGAAAIYGGTGSGKYAIVNHGSVVSPNFGIDFENGVVSNFGYIRGDEGIVILGSHAPGVVDNRGTVFGSEQAIFMNEGGVVTNHGEISSSNSFGIFLYHGGSIDNTGVVLGTYLAGSSEAVYVKDAAGTVVNSGTIGGHAGIRMTGGGTVVNSGKIEAFGGKGVYLEGGIVTNTGTILETGNYFAVGLGNGGSVLNRGLIKGDSGIDVLSGDATIVNAGTIIATGSDGEAVSFAGGGADRLIVDPGAAFEGNVIGDGGGSTLELARGKPGLLAGVGASFQSFGIIKVDPKATWHLSGAGSGSSLVNDGKIVVDTKQTMVFGTIGEDKGKHGTIDLVDSAAAEFKQAVDNGEKLAFTGPGGTLELDAVGSFQATISGFKKSDTIELADTAADKVRFSKGKLAITDAGTPVATLSLKGHYTTKEFVVTAAGSNTLITIGPPKAAALPVFVYAEPGGRGGNPGAREASAGGGRMESFVPFGGGAVSAAGAGDGSTLVPWAADPFHFWTIQG
jgi:hypothetical protein